MLINSAVPDMKCENCAKNITKALTEADLTFTVSLVDKKVVIDGCEKCAAKAVKAMTDLGFTPAIQE